jgi:hypothetical protein
MSWSFRCFLGIHDERLLLFRRTDDPSMILFELVCARGCGHSIKHFCHIKQLEIVFDHYLDHYAVNGRII